MLKVGIVGFGFIGKIHLATLRKTGAADVVAVADLVPGNLAGKADTGGNIAVDGDLGSLEGLRLYPDGDALLTDKDVDVALIALPTYLHRDYVLKAFDANKHVICEKPMALSVQEGKVMLTAAQRSGRQFFVAQCVRFWPAYARAREIVRDGAYGPVLRAHLSRLSPKPGWSWKGWLMDVTKSGGCLLDLHVHDVDYVNDVFGAPPSIQAFGIRHPSEGVGDVMAVYRYADGKVVTIEGGWEHHSTYPFRMAFRIVLDRATLAFDSSIDGQLRIHTNEGATLVPELSTEDGYAVEHRYFFDCLQRETPPARVTPLSCLEALKLVEAESRCLE